MLIHFGRPSISFEHEMNIIIWTAEQPNSRTFERKHFQPNTFNIVVDLLFGWSKAKKVIFTNCYASFFPNDNDRSASKYAANEPDMRRRNQYRFFSTYFLIWKTNLCMFCVCDELAHRLLITAARHGREKKTTGRRKEQLVMHHIHHMHMRTRDITLKFKQCSNLYNEMGALGR